MRWHACFHVLVLPIHSCMTTCMHPRVPRKVTRDHHVHLSKALHPCWSQWHLLSCGSSCLFWAVMKVLSALLTHDSHECLCCRHYVGKPTGSSAHKDLVINAIPLYAQMLPVKQQACQLGDLSRSNKCLHRKLSYTLPTSNSNTAGFLAFTS